MRERRGDQLCGTDEELFTGEVWIGRKAVEPGGWRTRLGTMREVIAERYPDAELQVVHARKSLAARLGLPAAGAAGGLPEAAVALVGALEQRASWARFGL